MGDPLFLVLVGIPLAMFAAGFALIVGLVLALRRRTRYFAIPLAVGALAGVLALIAWPQASPRLLFVIAFGMVAPLAGVSTLIGASLGWFASPTRVRAAFVGVLVMLAIASLVLCMQNVGPPAP